MTIETKIIRRADGSQHVVITRGNVVIATLPIETWFELSAVKYAMEMAVEVDHQVADY